MTVNVLLFAAAKDLAGTACVPLTAEPGLTVARLRVILLEICPKLVQVLPRSSIAVNREIAHEETVIKSGDEIAVIPPVSGG